MQRATPAPPAHTFRIASDRDTYHSRVQRIWKCECFLGIHTGDRVGNEIYGLIPRFCSCEYGKHCRALYESLPEAQEARRAWKMGGVERALKRSGVHAAFRNLRLADVKDNAKLQDLLQRYVQRWPAMQMQGWGIHFWGDIGRGKTHAMAVLCNELIEERQVQVMFLSMPDMARRLRAVVGGNAEDVPLLQEMMDCELLALDDMGTEKPSEWLVEQLYLIVNHRYEEKKPTICTSNQSLDDLGNFYMPQIASRLKERCKSVHFTGKNWRDELKPQF